MSRYMVKCSLLISLGIWRVNHNGHLRFFQGWGLMQEPKAPRHGQVVICCIASLSAGAVMGLEALVGEIEDWGEWWQRNMSKGWTFKKVLSGKIRVQPAKQWFRQQIKGFATFGLFINWQAWEFSHQRIGSYTVSIEDSGLVGPRDTANNERRAIYLGIFFFLV